MRYYISVFCIVMHLTCFSQHPEEVPFFDTINRSISSAIENIPSRSLNYIDKKYSRLSGDIQTQSQKLLMRMKNEEVVLQKKLQKIDSVQAQQLFEESKEKYQALEAKIQAPIVSTTAKLREFIPGLDTINTTLKFLSNPASIDVFNQDKLKQLSSAAESVQELQGRLQQANEIQSFIREREVQLKEVLSNSIFGKELLAFNKEAYYYQRQIHEYKELLNDRKKLEEKLIATVRTLPQFRSFMEKHSYLAMLFPQGENFDVASSLNGLQTRSATQTLISQRLGSSGSGANPQQFLQQQVQTAQAELNRLKDKINQLGGGSGGSDMTMPDFKPDAQKTKKFLQRLEYGLNVQSTRRTFLLPATSDIAATIGYKLNDKASAGLGLSYKLGWGDGWDNIKLSSQGIGLRSYIEVKAKGSVWISGGFEYNYMQEFTKIDEIKNIDVWQRSALTGLTKKIKAGKKGETKVQLLYDFLASKQIPQTQPIKFRIGWNF